MLFYRLIALAGLACFSILIGIASLHAQNFFDEPYQQGQFQTPHVLQPMTLQEFENFEVDDSDKIKPSPIEASYASRIVDELEQFGYDLFGVPLPETRQILRDQQRDHENSLPPLTSAVPMGAAQEEFVLQSGDALEIIFSGQRSDRDTYSVSNEGLILIEDFPPIPAAGRTIGQVRLSIDNAAQNLHNTQAHLSLAAVR